MKYALGFILSVLLAFGGLYLGVSFVLWELTSISAWEPSYRLFYLMLGAVPTIFFFAIFCDIIEGC